MRDLTVFGVRKGLNEAMFDLKNNLRTGEREERDDWMDLLCVESAREWVDWMRWVGADFFFGGSGSLTGVLGSRYVGS